MERWSLGWAIIIGAAALAEGATAAAQDVPPATRYVGSESCGACHERELTDWRITAHARAAAVVVAGADAGDRTERVDRARLRRCQGCHTTGDAPAGRPAFADVGCEACHGAGTAYAEDDVMRDPALSRLLGLRDLSTAGARAVVCGRCHDAAPTLMKFDPEAAWRRIAHPVALKPTPAPATPALTGAPLGENSR